MIGRRGFLGALAAAVAGGALDPERLLWEPGKRTFFDLWTPNPNLVIDFDWRQLPPLMFPPGDAHPAWPEDPDHVEDRQSGIRIRMLREWDIEPDPRGRG